MPNISTLTVRLSANSAKLVSEFSKAQKRAKTFGDKMKSSLRVVGQAFTRLAAGAAIGLTALTVAGIAAADSLAKTSAKLGIAANELAGLRFAAEQTGVPMRTLDLALQRMVRRVAEAATGTGEAKAAIRELGLDAKKLNQESPDEIFRQIADAMQGVTSQADKVRLGFKLFDSEGVAIVNTLKVGRLELQRFSAEAARFGLALTDTQLTKIEKAADAQNRVAKAFAGLGRQLAATFAPAIETASNATANLIARLTESIPQLTAVAAGILGIERAVDSLSTAEINAEIKNLRRLTGDAVDVRDQAAAQLARGAGGFASQIAQESTIKNAQARIDKYVARVTELRAELDRLANKTDQATTVTRVFGGVTATNSAALSAVREKMAQANAELDAYIANQNRLAGIGKSIFDSTRTGAEQYIAKMKEAREAFAGGFIDQETFERNRAMLLDGLVPAIDTVQKKTNDLGLTFSSAFEDAIVEGAKLRDVLKSIYQDMLRIIARRAVTEPLGDAFSGFLSKIIPGLATGGPVTAGQPYIVGDGGGPELFVPKQSGQVVAHGKYGGGGSFNFNYAIDARGADEARIMRILPAIMQQTEQRTLATLARLRTEGQV